MEEIKLPGHGAKERPEHLKVKDHKSATAVPYDWSKVIEDLIGNIANLFGITDRDQNGSGSCTCQATGYGFAYCTHNEISREDLYSNVALPGGGAYLNAPLDWLRNNGYLLLSQYPDPSPETEAAMTTKIIVKDNQGRIRTFSLSYKFYSPTIDAAAQAIQESDYIHLGIRGSWEKGWNTSWIDPQYEGQNNWQHALFAGKESIVLRHGIPAIKTKSSWTKHFDPQKQQVFCHYINKNYFANGGVFEVIGVSLKELNMALAKKTLNLDGEIGVFISVSEPGSLSDLNTTFGTNIVPNPDGSIPTDIKAQKVV